MLRPRWWERMYVDAVKYSKNCPECAVALGRGRSGPPLQPIPVSHVFQIVDVNIMDLPKTELSFCIFWQQTCAKFSIQMANGVPHARPEDAQNCETSYRRLFLLFGVPEALYQTMGLIYCQI